MRAVLVMLLVAATALFAVGAIAERSQRHGSTGAEVHATGESQEAGETGEAGETHTDASEAVLGVDPESTPLIVLAVLVGLGLAALVASRLGRLPGVLIAVALIAIAWAALDVREVVHQLDESRTGIAVIAMAVAVLHVAAALLAARMAARERRAADGSRGRPGTMPA